MFPKTTTELQTTTRCECKICGSSARYSYYGAIVCHSCKMFFRRTAEKEQTKILCVYDNKCEININTRRTCSSCRLAKCFANKMIPEMIRSPWSMAKEINRKKKSIADLKKKSLLRTTESFQFEQIPTLNLLQSDQSTLNADQWNLLSNLVYSFDEHCGYSFIKRFMHDQNALPVKLRFKYSSVSDFFVSVMNNVQVVFERNRDFLLLSLHDRSALLRSTVEYTTSIGGIFLMRQAHMFDYPSFYNAAEIIFRPSAVICIQRVIDRLDPDDTFIKLILAILAFSRMNYTVYTEAAPVGLTNISGLLPIQDMYTELAWRYLLHKYNYHEGVIRFLNLIRCLLQVNNAIVEAHESKQYTNMVDFVIEQTEQKLAL